MIVAGIDVGSLTAKCVIFEKEILSYSIIKVSPNLEQTARKVYEDAVKKAGVSAEYIVATGYGRNIVSFANARVTEITCHAIGAKSLFPSCRTVIDIGGQDSKVIEVEDGVKNFVMNDKCAAGTGRFLEMIASALNVELEKLGELDSKAEKPVNISSICAVFAESEVVSYIARGEKVENIVAGIHNAIASRIAAMAKRINLRPDVVLTGGVAKNKGVKRALEEILGMKILVPEEPQIVGALGAAIIGKNYADRRRKLERL